MQGKIIITAEETSETGTNVGVECHMHIRSPFDRFNLILSLAQALEFDECDWSALQLFRATRGKFQREEITTVDRKALAALLGEE